jgi:glucokinase
MYLGIEIGGTKIQLGVGGGAEGSDSRTEGRQVKLIALERFEVERSRGAEGIRQKVASIGTALVQRYQVRRIGIGFGGPVDAEGGRTIKSFHVEGWDGFPICAWCQQELGPPALVENDSNLAGLGEARYGAGNNQKIVLYSNVGSGIGGALVIDGKLYQGGSGMAVMEVGHLRPGTSASGPDHTIESIASGWSLAARMKERLRDLPQVPDAVQKDLLERSSGRIEELTGKIVVAAAMEGNPLAAKLFHQALQTYGWGLAQAITLLSPNVVVVGGGVPQAGEKAFFIPLRKVVDQYVLPALSESYKIVPAQLGEEVVLHGALALARGI